MCIKLVSIKELLFQVGSTCFGRCFRPSSGAHDCIYIASRQQLGWTLPDTVNTVKCSWWWVKHLLKHVELTWNNKLTYVVHLVGYFHRLHVCTQISSGQSVASCYMKCLKAKQSKAKQIETIMNITGVQFPLHMWQYME